MQGTVTNNPHRLAAQKCDKQSTGTLHRRTGCIATAATSRSHTEQRQKPKGLWTQEYCHYIRAQSLQ
eukprot:1145526-Pelagomonas_calceolata.AAC.7